MKRNKTLIYLLSPEKIKYKSFFQDLDKIFSTKKVSYFQLRLKKENQKNILNIAKNVKKICQKYKVKFILNDDPLLAKKIGADGCHLGQNDMKLEIARSILGKKIIGISCHGSTKLVKKASIEGANYLALGSFFPSKTKKNAKKAKIKIIKHVKKISNLPIVLIGGINDKNYKKLLLHKPNFLAISGYIWGNPKLNPIEAIKKLEI